jgi:secreted trypsin-like serine protease
MALVLENLPGGSEQLLCSGTVVSPDLVLTAGHCAVDLTTMLAQPADRYSVSTGSLDPNEDPSTQISAVSRVIVYPGFVKLTSAAGSTYLQGDAALLQLGTPTRAPAIQIADPEQDSSLYQANTPAAIAGWGLTAAGALPNQLQWGPTAVQGAAYCAQVAEQAFGADFDSATQTCALELPDEAVGTCNGDSGGPLIALRADGTPVQIGITSWAESHCSTDLPDYFTRTDALSGWIHAWMAALTPPPAAAPSGSGASPGAPAGTYRGSTSQRLPLELRIADNGRQLTALAFSFTARCTRRRGAFRRRFLAAGWRRSLDRHPGSWLSATFAGRHGVLYRLTLRLTTGGSAAGSLSASWHSRATGDCRSGMIRWAARDR